MKEYRVAEPDDITPGPDGALWFNYATATATGIGRITTNGSVTQYPDHIPKSAPGSITTGPDGALWFEDDGTYAIGRFTTAGTIKEYALPGGCTNVRGLSITRGPDGALWFTLGTWLPRSTPPECIGRITTSGAITLYPVRPRSIQFQPNATADLGAIAAGPDGALWFIEQNFNSIGRITTSGTITEFPIPTVGSVPFGIIAGPDGALWFTEQGQCISDAGVCDVRNVPRKIGRITTAGAISEYPIPASNSSLWGIAAGLDGNRPQGGRSGGLPRAG